MEDVRQGLPLSRSFSLLPRTYSRWHVQLIAVGEQTGTLPDALGHLAELLTQRARLRRSILSATAYPTFILCGTVAISSFLIFFAFPKILPIFRGLHVALPPSTRALMYLMHAATDYGFFIASAIFLFFVICASALRLKSVRLWTDRALVCFPFIGNCVRHYCISTIFRSLHVLLKSGVRLDTALIVIVDATWNTAYRQSLLVIERFVISGAPGTAGMRANPKLYPKPIVEILAVGERTGTLSDSARVIADLCEETLQQELQSRTAIIEPVLMVFMGCIVGFIALAIITPMYALTQSLTLQ
jgi:type II secretory pathway component PulF